MTELDDITRLRTALARIARQQRQLSSTGLTPTQQSVLGVINRLGPIPLGDLARIEAVAPPTITRIVAKLESMDLVARSIDPDDRRVARVSITDGGHRGLLETRRRRNQWLEERLQSLPEEDAAAIIAAIGPLEALIESGNR